MSNTLEIKQLLKDHNLRATAPRVAVISLLQSQHRPMSYSEVAEALGDQAWDPATLFRNLVKLEEAGLARVVSHAGGMARYELTIGQDHSHIHPHFVCTDCGAVSCLSEISIPVPDMSGPWGESIRSASVQFQGRCPTCLS